MARTIDDVWNEFQSLYGSEVPVRNKDQLRAALQAAGVRYEQVTPEWIDENVLPEWIDGTDSRPFSDEARNDEYSHLCARHGIDTSDPFDEDDFDEQEFNEVSDDE